MKAGLIISISAHLLILVILLISFPAPQITDTTETVEVPISLAPLSEKTSVQEGEKQEQDSAAPSPKPTEKPEVKPEAEHAGDANIDTPMPLKPKEKPREVESAPPEKGQDEGINATSSENEAKEFSNTPEEKTETQEQPQEQPENTVDEPKPADTEVAPSEKNASQEQVENSQKAEKTNTEISNSEQQSNNENSEDNISELLKTDDQDAIKQPEENTQQSENQAEKQQNKIEKPKEDNKQPEPEKDPAKPDVPDLPNKAPVPSAAPEPEEKPVPPKSSKSAPAQGEEDGVKSDQDSNALIDRTRTQGGGAKRSENNAGQGANKKIGDNDHLQQALNNIIGACVSRNWDIGVIQGSSAYDLRVQMHFKLNKDGTLAGEPDLRPAGGDLKDRDVISVQARAALKKCTPFRLPADRYRTWRDVTVNMKAFPD